jgi:hypothetical protein
LTKINGYWPLNWCNHLPLHNKRFTLPVRVGIYLRRGLRPILLGEFGLVERLATQKWTISWQTRPYWFYWRWKVRYGCAILHSILDRARAQHLKWHPKSSFSIHIIIRHCVSKSCQIMHRWKLACASILH